MTIARMAESVPIASTRLLRESADPLFRRLRALLAERGLDSQKVVLADLFPDDVDQEFGVLVTQDRRVIQFVVHYGRLGDINRQTAEATIGEWSDISSWWDATPHASAIRVALDLAADT